MKIYEVITKCYDNGKVIASMHELECDTIPESTFEETKRCDIYHDYFTDRSEALQMIEDAKNA